MGRACSSHGIGLTTWSENLNVRTTWGGRTEQEQIQFTQHLRLWDGFMWSRIGFSVVTTVINFRRHSLSSSVTISFLRKITLHVISDVRNYGLGPLLMPNSLLQYAVHFPVHLRFRKVISMRYVIRKSFLSTGLDKTRGFLEVQAPMIFRESAHEGGKVVSPMHQSPLALMQEP
jgi:hypothetical protein